MGSFADYIFREGYVKIEKFGGGMVEVDLLIDWETFRPIVAEMFDNRGEKGGRPNID